jgi:hypothetical protein
MKSNSLPIKITYCHYPLFPQLIIQKAIYFGRILVIPLMNFLKNKRYDALKTFEKYNQMMNNTFTIT